MSNEHKGSITELICTREGRQPEIRYYYTYGDDPVDMIIDMYTERGFSVAIQYFDPPKTEFGCREMAAFLERHANRFYEMKFVD